MLRSGPTSAAKKSAGGKSPTKKQPLTVVQKKNSIVYRQNITAEVTDGAGIAIGSAISQEKEIDLQTHLVELQHLRTLNIEMTRERGVCCDVQKDVLMLRGQLGRANDRITSLEKVRMEQDADITQLEKVRDEHVCHITWLEKVRF